MNRIIALCCGQKVPDIPFQIFASAEIAVIIEPSLE